MKRKLTLVVMAAGMGSRFGGMKQVEAFGPNGETLLEYSVFDAWRAGFSKVVFIIRREMEATFREKVLSRFSENIEVELVFQELDALPEGYRPPAERTKPWGTGQAVLAAKGAIAGPFAVINADDFYGSKAFQLVADFFEEGSTSPLLTHAMVSYPLGNTLSEHGSVSRGICKVDTGACLQHVEEHHEIEKNAEGVIHAQRSNGESAILNAKDRVSLNFWAFEPAFLDSLKKQFATFLEQHSAELKSEFYLPAAINADVLAGRAEVRVLESEQRWFGVTYREDAALVKTTLKQWGDEGEYPRLLFVQK